jgi:hypothetical protein
MEQMERIQDMYDGSHSKSQTGDTSRSDVLQCYPVLAIHYRNTRPELLMCAKPGTPNTDDYD